MRVLWRRHSQTFLFLPDQTLLYKTKGPKQQYSRLYTVKAKQDDPDKTILV